MIAKDPQHLGANVATSVNTPNDLYRLRHAIHVDYQRANLDT